jgi:hypothetical protein
MEFQDPTVTCCGEPEAKSDRHGDRGQSRVARHSANNPGFRHTPVGGGNCCGSGDLPFRRHRHDDHRALDCDGGYPGGRDHNRSGSMNQHPKPSAPWLTPLAGEDACQFYNDHGLNDGFGGVVTDREGDARISKAPMHAEQPDLLD